MKIGKKHLPHIILAPSNEINCDIKQWRAAPKNAGQITLLANECEKSGDEIICLLLNDPKKRAFTSFWYYLGSLGISGVIFRNMIV